MPPAKAGYHRATAHARPTLSSAMLTSGADTNGITSQYYTLSARKLLRIHKNSGKAIARRTLP
jgi:hypothetical protein